MDRIKLPSLPTPSEMNWFSMPGWPPEQLEDSGIEYREHSGYRGTPGALIAAKVLRPEDTPGHPDCPRKWGRWGWCNGVRFGAMRIGDEIIVQLYE